MYVNDYYENKKGNKILFIIVIAVLFILGVIFLFIRIPSKSMKDTSKKQGEVKGKIEEKTDKKDTKKDDNEKQEVTTEPKKQEETSKEENEEEIKNEPVKEETDEVKENKENVTTEKKVTKSTPKKNISKIPIKQSGVIATVKTYY